MSSRSAMVKIVGLGLVDPKKFVSNSVVRLVASNEVKIWILVSSSVERSRGDGQLRSLQ